MRGDFFTLARQPKGRTVCGRMPADRRYAAAKTLVVAVGGSWVLWDSPRARRNSLFFAAVREFGGPGSSRRARRNRQKSGPEQADNRRLLLPVTRILRLCFCCVFFGLTGGENLLREKWSASKPFEVRHTQGLQRASARPCKALFRALKSLFLFVFFGSKNLHRNQWTAGVPPAWAAQVSRRRWRRETSPRTPSTGFELRFRRACKALFCGVKLLILLRFYPCKKSERFAPNELDRGRPRPHREAFAALAGEDARGPSAGAFYDLKPLLRPVRRSSDARCGSAFPSARPARSGPAPAPIGPEAGRQRPSSIPCGALR